nr:hypothetical protein [Fodinibius sp.]
EAAPPDQDIQTSFGTYKTDYVIQNHVLKYRRMFRIDQRLIPVEQYQEYRSFMKAVRKNDQTKFVFKKT